MALKPPLMELPIETAERGFYRGFTVNVTVTAKLLIGAPDPLGHRLPGALERLPQGNQRGHPGDVRLLVRVRGGVLPDPVPGSWRSGRPRAD